MCLPRLSAHSRSACKFVQLGDVAGRLTATELPLCEVVCKTLPGRAGWISAQVP